MLIFQFTLPREERRQVQAQPLTLQNFNPRSHERSDHFQRTLWRLLCHISIHAPTRGATMGDGYQEVQEVISIHAPTRGATSLKATEYKLSIDFNPRSHERSDNYIPDEFKSYIISIHAPTRGATCIRYIYIWYVYISIHAPTRGATRHIRPCIFQT